MFIDQKKASLVLTLKILQEYSDENHYLTQQDIIDKLYNKYDLLLERKTIASNINLLEELGYDISRGAKGGVCLINRLFDSSEIKFLIDAVYSSKTITGKQAHNIANSISSTLSIYDQKQYNYLFKSQEINRNINNDFFYNIELINEAIHNNKMISFQYITFNKSGKEVFKFNGFKYKVSPYYLINNFGKYYLLSNYKNDGASHFRVDYMRNIEILDTKRIPIDTIEYFGKNFNISKYINNHIYMFGGKVIDAIVEIENEQSIAYVKDWFGTNTDIYTKDDKIYAKIKCDDKAFIHWCLQYINSIKVIEPLYLKDQIIDILQTNLDKYKTK